MKSVSLQNQNVSPNKIVCIGRNYVSHIKELQNEVPQEMVIFFKPNSSIEDELYASKDGVCHFEGELCFLYKDNKLAKVAFGLDLTKRDIQSNLKAKGLPWERAKAFRGSALFSEFVSFETIDDLSLELYVNDVLVQKGGVSMMINKPKEVVDEVLTFSNLDEYDIIMSGTPSGVGAFYKNDVLVGKVFEKDTLLVEKKWVAK